MSFGLAILLGEMGPKKCGGHLLAGKGFGVLNRYHGFQKRYADIPFRGALAPVTERDVIAWCHELCYCLLWKLGDRA